MPNVSREVILALSDLIQTCRDSEAGFGHAAQSVKDSELRALFESYSRQAGLFAIELQEEVRRLGGTPAAAAVFDRFDSPGWLTIECKLGGEDEAAILAECYYGAEAAEKSYAAVLTEALPREAHQIVQRQYDAVKTANERIHALAGHHPFGVRLPCQEREAALPRGRQRRHRRPPAGRLGGDGVFRESSEPAPPAQPA